MVAQESRFPPSMTITETLSSSALMDLVSRSHASLGGMYRINSMSSSIFDLDVLLNKILDETFAIIRAEGAFILLIDPNNDQLEIKASRWQEKEGLDQKVSISQNIISYVLEKKAKLNFDLDPQFPKIQADPQGIHRCLLNLLTNALDALNKDGGEVIIRIRRESESEVAISVEDNGAGIPEKARERIFDVFFSTKGSKGTGLGLAITKKITEEHGGRIEAHCDPGQRTIFSIELPVDARDR